MSSPPNQNVDFPIRPGDVLDGRYRVQRLMAVGGMGAVFEAMHVELHQRVAVKAMLRELSTSGEATQRFIQEARAAAELRSINVARVLDVARLPSGEPYIVMEYLEGKDLRATLDERGTLPVDLAVDWIVQACDAMAEAHAAGIIHRDLKLSNLFVAQRGRFAPVIKVLDFGISKITRNSFQCAMTSAGAIMGSPGYMAPEQLRDSKMVDQRCDVWSLGVILYELLTGKPAYEGDTLPQLTIRVFTEAPMPIRQLRAEVPPELEAFILYGAIQRDLAKRTPSVVELVRGLRPFASEQGRLDASRIISLYQDADIQGVSKQASTVAPSPSRAASEAEIQQVKDLSDSSARAKASAPAPRPFSSGTEGLLEQAAPQPSTPGHGARSQIIDCGGPEHEILSGTPYRFKQLVAVHRLGELVAAQAPNGRDVLVRVAHPQIAATPQELSRVRAVADVLLSLHHPNIATIADLGRTAAGRLFVAWEADGGQLLSQSLPRQGAFPIGEAVDHTRQILSALSAAHQSHVFHGSLTSGSIVLSIPVPGQHAPKVIDFALEAATTADKAIARDVIGAARVLFASVTGREAPPDGVSVPTITSSRGEIPAELMQIMREAMRPDSPQYRTVSELDQGLAAVAVRLYANLPPSPVRPSAAPRQSVPNNALRSPSHAAIQTPQQQQAAMFLSPVTDPWASARPAEPKALTWWTAFLASFLVVSGTALWLLNHFVQ